MEHGFPEATREDWLRLVEAVLKGAPYDKRLVTRTRDGFTLDALPPRRSDAAPIAGRAPGARWRVISRIEDPDPVAANAQALEDLEGGSDGIALIFASAPSARGFGLPETAEAISRALDAVMLDLATLRVEVGKFQGRNIALALAALAEKQGLPPTTLDIRFGLDPIGDFAALGAAPIEWEALSARLGQTVTTLRSRAYRAPMVRADGRIHHAAGATDVQELAAVLATALAYLRALEGAGLDLVDAARSIEVAITADVAQFATMAKLRALRLLWARALEACGVTEPPPLAIHAETAWRSLTRRDAHVNLLRSTLAAFAGGVGGADSLTVLPFSEALGLPDGFARRLARNTQFVLMEESNLHRVTDPAAGAGAVEEHTDKLSEAAWELFRAIERKGGMVEALASGMWQAMIEQARIARMKDIATRRAPITGTSEFPLLGEAKTAVLAPAAAPPPGPPPEGALLCEPLQPHRLAEPFEQLRDAAERAPTPPQVFLANLGDHAAFAARAGFARNLFGAGGILAPMNSGFATIEDAVVAFRASNARLVCLCSSDEFYGGHATDAVAALRQAGAHAVWLAGKPEAAPEGGVDGFIFAGCDALAVITSAHRHLGLNSL
ncbi:MAG: Methylmalonyl-CoA mutase [Xanthobacteraceae bacterium]|jgi:methylmalonyl-CoA mutase|nr:Methylmalonyl-CoA mutase [Xanthobacteraceae bacterium]